ncbi:MAG: phage shock protein B [Pseudohongiellaceae bacterium]|jgi:phage shock protein B
MGVLEFILSLVAITLTAITIWIVLLKKSRRQASATASGALNMDELTAMATSLNERIDVLESILDAEVPDWREQDEQHGE